MSKSTFLVSCILFAALGMSVATIPFFVASPAQQRVYLSPEIAEPAHHRSYTVTVRTDEDHFGTGVVYQVNGEILVWTAGHLLWNRNDGQYTGDVHVTIEVYGATGRAAITEMPAQILAVSNPWEDYDLALLRVPMGSAVFNRSQTAVFATDSPEVGEEVWHVGSLHGFKGAQSVTDGVVASVGRSIFSSPYPLDQITCEIMPGSSGGGAYLKDTGEFIGMVVQYHGPGFGLMVPVRDIRIWAKREGYGWVFKE